MSLSTNSSIFFNNRMECFANKKLQALDQCLKINKLYPMHQQIHKIIENIQNVRLQKSLRQSGLDLIMNFEWSLSISATIRRFSENIISLCNVFLFLRLSKIIYNYRI